MNVEQVHNEISERIEIDFNAKVGIKMYNAQ